MVITLFFFMGCGRLVVEVEIMSGLIDFLTTEEMIVVYSLVGIASVLYLIIYFFDKTYYKRKQRQNTRELQKIVDEISPVEDKKEDKVVSSEPVLIPIQEEESRKDVVVEVSDQAVTPMENVLEEVSSLEDVVKKDAELLTTTEIKEDTVSLESISDIENSVSTGHFEVFSVNGYKILEGEKFADNFSADLPAGIYVLRKDGISSKIIIGK